MASQFNHIFSAQSSNCSYLESLVRLFNACRAHRSLIFELFKRDVFMVYKKSFLGLYWVFLTPVISVVSWVFMNYVGLIRPGETEIPYPAYVLLGTSLWSFFIGCFGALSNTLLSGRGFITQINFPHEVLIIKQFLSFVFGFFVFFLLIIIALLFFRVQLSPSLFFFPLSLIPLALLASGLGLLLSVVSIVAIDVKKVMDIFIGALFFITPIIYSESTEHEFLKSVLFWNPLTYLVSVPRSFVTGGDLENIPQFIGASGASLLLFLVSLRIFFISEKRIVERMM